MGNNLYCLDIQASNITIDMRKFNISSTTKSGIILGTGKNNVTIINGSIQGFAEAGIYTVGNNNCTFRDIKINNTPAGGYGLYITTASKNNKFINVSITRTAYGIGVDHSYYNTFEDVKSYGNGIRGLYFYESYGNIIQNPVFANNTVWDIMNYEDNYNTLVFNMTGAEISWYQKNLTTAGNLTSTQLSSCAITTWAGFLAGITRNAVCLDINTAPYVVGFNPTGMNTALNTTVNISSIGPLYAVPTVVERVGVGVKNCTTCYIAGYEDVGFGGGLRMYRYNVSYATANYSISWLPDYYNGTRTFNSTTYETAYESSWVNYSFIDRWWPDAKMYLWYNNSISAEIGPTTSGDVHTYTYQDDIMAINYPTNISFKWELRLNATYIINTTNASVLIKPTYLAPAASDWGIENATQKYCVLNISFLDETTSDGINATVNPLDITYYLGHGGATKTVTYINATNVSKVMFCFNASLDSYEPTGEIAIRYKQDPLYGERYSSTTRDLITTDPILNLYLLSVAAGGTDVSFAVQTQGGTPIPLALVTVERYIDGSWITIGSDSTGDDGVVTFSLNSLYNHRITFEKSGYTTRTVTIRPTQSFYTVYLDSGMDVTANQTTIGFAYSRAPTETTLKQNSYYNFTYVVMPTNVTGLQAFRLSLLFTNGSTWNSTVYGSLNSTGSTGLRVLMDNVSNGVTARYYINTTNYTQWYQVGATRYSVYNFSTGRGSLWQAILNIDEYRQGDVNTQFTTAFFSLLILLVLLASFNYLMGFELSNPGQALVLVTIIIGMLSVGGLLTVGLPGGNAFFEKYILLIITMLFAGGYWISRLRDTG